MVNFKKEAMNYIKSKYSSEISMLQSQKRKGVLWVDYTGLNSHLEEVGINPNRFYSGYQENIKMIEDWLNKKREPKYKIDVKIVDIPPNCNLRDLDVDNNGERISTKAMIKNITGTQIELKEATFKCNNCQHFYTMQYDQDSVRIEPGICTICGKKSWSMMNELTRYTNYKLVKLEEPLELRRGGETKEFKGYLKDYLASSEHILKAGDVCDIYGLFQVKRIKNKDSFEFMINLDNIQPVDNSFEDFMITDEDREKILKLSRDPLIYKRLVETIAPEVYGYDVVKKGLLLQLFEGARPEDGVNNGERWTIHILLIGDPGIGKSQIIESVNKKAPKVITISGTGATRAGLTTSAVRDELTGTWALEAGAVVLADTGLLCVDEYDKLTETTQKALNEPMEQMVVSSAKAGLVQTMTARTSVLACANPKNSKFDMSSSAKSIQQQINIPESNLSRFDLVFALTDNIDREKDGELARALLTHDYSRRNVSELIDDNLFKKYITYAKIHCHPVLSHEAIVKLQSFYVETRQAALQSDDGKPITTRDLKAIERLSVARAKCELSDEVTLEHAEEAISIYTEALATVGLVPENAGAIQGVKSKKELNLIRDCEELIRAEFEMYGKVSHEAKKDIMGEISARTDGGNYEVSEIYKEAYNNMALEYDI